MRTAFLSGLILISGLALLGGCSSDSPSPVTTCVDSCAENQEIAEFVVTNNCYWLPSDQNILNQDYLIYIDGKVTDTKGNEIGTFDSATGTMTLNDGTTVENIDLSSLTELTPQKVEQAKEDVQSATSTQSAPSSEGSSTGGSDTPASSGTGTSASTEESSSSAFVNTSPLSKMSLEGYPVASYKSILGNGTRGWNTRYWDACKPHCAWISNGAEGKTDTTTQESYEKGLTTARNCNIHDIEVPTFTLGHAVQQYWMGFEGTTSACEIGKGGVFTCTDMAPIAVNDTLSYAYVAGPSNSVCGKCYHLQYDGHFKDEDGNNAPKPTHKALQGKHIIVMSSNIGHDVKEGQFDLMVPGGGVGIYDALSTQVNKGGDFNWGAQYGGFLTYCQRPVDEGGCGYDGTLKCYQDCIHERCDAAFKDSGFDNLYRGCNWFADWYMAADNPTYQWEEVECPQYLLDHYLTTLNKEKSNRYRWHDDWSTYNGEELETQECLTEKYPQGCGP